MIKVLRRCCGMHLRYFKQLAEYTNGLPITDQGWLVTDQLPQRAVAAVLMFLGLCTS